MSDSVMVIGGGIAEGRGARRAGGARGDHRRRDGGAGQEFPDVGLFHLH